MTVDAENTDAENTDAENTDAENTDAENTDAENTNAENTDVDQGEVPLCLHCIRPVSPLDHYCPHCGQSIGQLTPYLPYESIWFTAGIWGKLWNRLWYRDIDSFPRKCFYVFLIVIGAPILILALPTVCGGNRR